MGRGEGQRAGGDGQKLAPASPGRDGSESKSSPGADHEIEPSPIATAEAVAKGIEAARLAQRDACAKMFVLSGYRGRSPSRRT
jgi:hypothetical protein